MISKKCKSWLDMEDQCGCLIAFTLVHRLLGVVTPKSLDDKIFTEEEVEEIVVAVSGALLRGMPLHFGVLGRIHAKDPSSNPATSTSLAF
jgi:hypothetical protein